MRQGNNDRVSATVMTFPNVVVGKPLISHREEKLEFRLISIRECLKPHLS